MIITIPETPDNIVALKATGEITKEDYENCVLPQIEVKLNQFGELNCLLLLDTDVSNFTLGAWYEDAIMALKNFANWNRVAVVTNSVAIQNSIAAFSVVMPGEYETFDVANIDNAIYWCANGNQND